MQAIQLENLTKHYGKARGITNVSLTVPKGAFFGFIGPNGAGKSTTIRTILQLIKEDSGSIKILGLDPKVHKELMLSKIGYLPSEAIFYNGMKVKEILKLANELHSIKKNPYTKQLCERLQLDVSKKVNDLSFGNRKKVAIVAALQHKPELLILDEPTSGLDPLMQKEFFKILRELNENGTTIFMSSHILSEIQKNCKQAAIIKEGKIIAVGDVSELAKTNAKHITISPKVDISSLEGLKNINEDDDTLDFLYSGDLNALIQLLKDSHIDELKVEEPDLEEIFMHYYEDGGATNDNR